MTLFFRASKPALRSTGRQYLVVELLEDRRVLSTSGFDPEFSLLVAADIENPPEYLELRPLVQSVQILGQENSREDSKLAAPSDHEQETNGEDQKNRAAEVGGDKFTTGLLETREKSEGGQSNSEEEPDDDQILEKERISGERLDSPENEVDGLTNDRHAFEVSEEPSSTSNVGSEDESPKERVDATDVPGPPTLPSPSPTPSTQPGNVNSTTKPLSPGDGDRDNLVSVNEDSTNDGDEDDLPTVVRRTGDKATEPDLNGNRETDLDGTMLGASQKDDSNSSVPSFNQISIGAGIVRNLATPDARSSDGFDSAHSAVPAPTTTPRVPDDLTQDLEIPAVPEISLRLSESLPQFAELLREVAPYDLAALDGALRGLLDQMEEGAMGLIQPEISGKLMSWLLVGALTTAGLELTRRRMKRSPEFLMSADNQQERSSGLRFHPISD